MAIYTRYGSEVKIISKAVEKDHEGIVIERISDGKHFFATPLELQADGGLVEIDRAIEKL